jgi:hypothetical protein
MTAVMELRKRRKDAFKEQHGVNLGFHVLLHEGGDRRAQGVPGGKLRAAGQ